MEWTRDRFLISTDPDRLDREVIHRFLAGSYWAPDIPRAIVDRSIDHSMPFGLYDGARLVGFARIITDYSTFAYVSDVFVLESHRGQGLAQWLMEIILDHPDLKNLRRWVLLTRNAHPLYRRVGFRELEDASRYMEIVDRDVYVRMNQATS